MQQMAQWNENVIANRLEEAANTMRRLPEVEVQGYVSAWPEIAYSAYERYQMEDKSRLWPATPEQIARMEEACGWLLYLINVEDRRLLWLRAERVRWNFICAKLGIARATANRRWKNALRMISLMLS